MLSFLSLSWYLSLSQCSWKRFFFNFLFVPFEVHPGQDSIKFVAFFNWSIEVAWSHIISSSLDRKETRSERQNAESTPSKFSSFSSSLVLSRSICRWLNGTTNASLRTSRYRVRWGKILSSLRKKSPSSVQHCRRKKSFDYFDSDDALLINVDWMKAPDGFQDRSDRLFHIALST